MEEIPETYDLQSIEQLRAVADPLRIRIYEALSFKPMTATQVGEELDEPAPKAHYHVRELERLGLVRLVETRERGGILEKYYRAVARGLRVPPSILQQAPPDEVAGTMSDILDSIVLGFKAVMSQQITGKVANWDASMLTLSANTLWITPTEFQGMLKSVQELLKPYSKRRGVEGEHEITMNVISYDARLARAGSANQPERLVSPTPPNPPTPPTPPIPPVPSIPPAPSVSTWPKGSIRTEPDKAADGKARKVVVAGAVNYSRRELQEIADRGERIDLTVIGYLSFANDVPADLVRRVIERLSYRGVLTAPDDVREALREKEGGAS